MKKVNLLVLFTLCCFHLVLVGGRPAFDQRRDGAHHQVLYVGKDTARKPAKDWSLNVPGYKQPASLNSDDKAGRGPAIDPYRIQVEQINSTSPSINGPSSFTTTSHAPSVVMTPTTVTPATRGASTSVQSMTTSVPSSFTVTVSVSPTPSEPSPSRTASRSTSSSSSTQSSSSSSRRGSASVVPATTNTPTKEPRRLPIPLIAGCAAGGGVLVALCLLLFVVLVVCCVRRQRKRRYRFDTKDGRDSDTISQLSDVLDSIQVEDDSDSNLLSFSNAEGDAYDKCYRSVLDRHQEYQPVRHQRMDLGSRMQKRWYSVRTKDNGQERKILTIAPVSQHCPLKLHKHQKGLNNLLGALKEHPYLHPIEVVEYLSDHELLAMVQPFMKSGSLKDMIYKATPRTSWSDKYARRREGLTSDKIRRYGRQILEAMKFLYSKGFPTLGHVQSGNIFVVDEVCHLGGYENTLLGYKTRLYRLCKDHLKHFDVIMFGHLVFEMAAGYELTHLRPLEAEYKTIDTEVRQILEFIFADGFPNDIAKISEQDFFSDSIDELSDFDSNKVQLDGSMKKVLEKVRKGKIRVQKSTKPKEATPREAKPKEGGGTLTSRVKSTFRGIVPRLGRGSGEDSEGGQLTKTQRKFKTTAKDGLGVDPRPLLGGNRD